MDIVGSIRGEKHRRAAQIFLRCSARESPDLPSPSTPPAFSTRMMLGLMCLASAATAMRLLRHVCVRRRVGVILVSSDAVVEIPLGWIWHGAGSAVAASAYAWVTSPRSPSGGSGTARAQNLAIAPSCSSHASYKECRKLKLLFSSVATQEPQR